MSKPIKALLNHVYIGTLIHSCKATDVDVIAVQEAAGFGSDIQKHNWPEVPNVPDRSNWIGTEQVEAAVEGSKKWFMIAQPPCAGGSMVTPTHARGGLDNPNSAFHVTHDYMKYAYGLKPPIIAVESVPGTYRECAEDIYKMRDMYGPEYGVFYVFDNSSHYGCVSLRKRLWHVHYRKDLFPEGLEWSRGAEKKRTVRDALQGADQCADHVISKSQQNTYDRYKTLFDALPQGYYANNFLRKTGRWDLVDPKTIKTKKPNEKTGKPGEMYVFYESVSSKRLAWDELAPTITGSTFLVHPEENRPLTTREYLRINNMPDSFTFPPNMGTGKHITYIGKTVSTGIAEWVIENIKKNLDKLED